MENQKHYLAAVLAFVVWGFFSIPLRALQGFAASEILYFRILSSTIVLLMIALFFRRRVVKENYKAFINHTLQRRKMILGLILAGAVLLTVNWLTFIYIVNNINIRTASFSYFICPVLTAVLGFVLLREKMTVLQWSAVGLCTASCLLIGISSAAELAYSFLTAITYALYLITQRKNQGFDRLIILTIQVLVGTVILSFYFNLLVTSVPVNLSFYIIILIIAVFFTILPLFLNLYALNKINAATIGILMYINPLLNFGLAILFFNERLNYVQLCGYVLIIAALTIFNYPNFKKVKALTA